MPTQRYDSRMVQVSPNELRSRRPGENAADVRARYKRERELEARLARALRGLNKYDTREKASDKFTESVIDIGLSIPRELARRRYKEVESELREVRGQKKGGKVKKMAKGGKVSCRRGDGICRQGHTKGKMR